MRAPRAAKCTDSPVRLVWVFLATPSENYSKAQKGQHKNKEGTLSVAISSLSRSGILPSEALCTVSLWRCTTRWTHHRAKAVVVGT